jgi:maltooligosyltrehalose synthase
VVEDVLSMNSSNFGGSRYYYFYDWQIQLGSTECVSDRVEIPVLVDNVQEVEFGGQVNIAPNPTSGQVQMSWPRLQVGWSNIQVFDYTGRLLLEDRVQDNTITLDMASWPAGMYWIKVQEGNSIYSNKVIKQ